MRILPLIIAAAWQTVPAATDVVGSRVCASCHAEIAKRYSSTGMARTSAAVNRETAPERFHDVTDPTTGAVYRISRDYRVDFQRPSTGASGVVRMKWAIGSGAVGRSYITEVDGFLFQSPVSWFAAAARWDLSPGFAGKPMVDIARAIEEPCLQCHTTGPRLIPGTQHRYLDPPFAETGIGCERCHGAGRRHVEAAKSGAADVAIVNPLKLEARRRDSICLQCHLTGAARVVREGRTLSGYVPGELLSDYVSVFVRTRADGQVQSATDHAEQLFSSKCKQSSGERLWCGSCHDAHGEPAATDRTGFYRNACLQCHSAGACTDQAQRRASKEDDCRSCHMPKVASREGDHVAFTLHSIPRRPAAAVPATSELKSFFPVGVSERDLALAYAGLAIDDPAVRPRALELLESAARQAGRDAVLLAQLAQFYDLGGRRREAASLYRRVLEMDPKHPAAGANLGIYAMQDGDVRKAIQLWTDVFERYPALIAPGLNLAAAQYNAGDLAGAEVTLRRVLRFHPDSTAARQLLARVRTER